MENIIEVRDDESLQTGSYRVNFFFINFRKLLENIVGVRDDESLQTGSYRGIFFSEIIGKYCRGARRRISSDRFL
jgi:hypothetical protein